MGACGSSPSADTDGEQKKKSQAIDRSLEEDSKKLRRECKILLLGGCRCLYASTTPINTVAQVPARVERVLW